MATEDYDATSGFRGGMAPSWARGHAFYKGGRPLPFSLVQLDVSIFPGIVRRVSVLVDHPVTVRVVSVCVVAVLVSHYVFTSTGYPKSGLFCVIWF